MKDNNNSTLSKEQRLNSKNLESCEVKNATVKNKSKQAKAKPKSIKSAVKKHKKAPRVKAKNQTKINTSVKIASTKKSSVNPKINKSKNLLTIIDAPKENRRQTQTPQLKKLEGEFLHDSTETLPNGYGDHRLTLIARDPHWVFCFWEIDSAKLEKRRLELGDFSSLPCWSLRVYRHSTGNNKNEELVSDFVIDLPSGKLYLELSPSGSTFTAELGIMDVQNNFGRILTSNTIDLPAEGPSNNNEEIWTKGESIQKVFIQSAKSGVEKSELNIQKRPIESFGESSASRYTNSKR